MKPQTNQTQGEKDTFLQDCLSAMNGQTGAEQPAQDSLDDQGDVRFRRLREPEPITEEQNQAADDFKADATLADSQIVDESEARNYARAAKPRRYKNTDVHPLHLATSTFLSLVMVLVLYAYGGWNDAAFVTAEIRRPRSNIPVKKSASFGRRDCSRSIL